MTSSGNGGAWGSSTIHQRAMRPYPPTPRGKGRRRCWCGCKTWCTHVGTANGVALVSGCELVIRRWVRDGDTAIDNALRARAARR